MKALVGLSLLLLLGCSESEPPKRGVPSYSTKKPEVKPEIYYQLPDGIPIEMALVYKDYQELMTEEQFGLWLMSIKGFCDGAVTGASLKARINVWFPELHAEGLPGDRIPDYNRTRDGRINAWIFWQTVRRRVPVEVVETEKPAPDSILSKANRDEFQAQKVWYDKHLRGKIYDCVEGY